MTWLDAEPAALPDANHALQAAKDLRHDEHPPAGAPVYIKGSHFGHIALSTGGGRIYSTDWPSRGLCSEVKIKTLCRTWGRTYAGWSTDYAGQPIPGLGDTIPPFVGTVFKGMDGPRVKAVQRRLREHGFTIKIDSRFGPVTEQVVKAFQKKKGLEIDGRVGPKTWAALWR
jgi:Putative peptidoglycan binding domain